MCPFDVTMVKALSYSEMFLPTYNTHDRKNSTYGLWFDEFMGFWKACPNSVIWEGSLVALIGRLADHTSGYIDWDPFVPTFLTRIQHAFHLPVKYKDVGTHKKVTTGDLTSAVKWIVATMGDNSLTMQYLEQMFSALDSYYHTANYGHHTQKLNEFVYKLTTALTKRLHKERYARKITWGSVVPEAKKLTDDDVTRFVKCVQPIVLHIMYSKTGLGEAGHILQHLATLRPEIVIPPVLERLFTALDTVTEPHKLTAAMTAVTSMSRTLVNPGTHYKEGPTHVIPLLMAAIPGIDPNDQRKSMIAFQFISTFCSLIPLVDVSTSTHHFKVRFISFLSLISINAIQFQDLTEEEAVICGQTAQLEDFVVQFLDQCFAVIESSSLLQTREEMSLNDHRNSREEQMKDIGLSSTFNSILKQSSASLYDLALNKVKKFVSGRILETKIAGRIAASLCRCLVKAKPEKGLAAFIPKSVEILDDLVQVEAITDETKLDDEIKFNMLILSECVRGHGKHLVPYVDDIKKILRKTLCINSKEGSTASCPILRHLLRSLTSLFPSEYRAFPEGVDQPLEEWMPIRDWGRPGVIRNLKVSKQRNSSSNSLKIPPFL